MNCVRGIRGAVRADRNTREAILDATKRLLQEMADANDVNPDDIASVFLTTTPDLNAEFPAYVVRELGWKTVPLLCAREIDVPHGMGSLVRILIHINTDRRQDEITHVYLGETAKLRPDLEQSQP
jgi:chorismate mutase